MPGPSYKPRKGLPRTMFPRILAISALLLLAACTRGETGLEGTLLFRDAPLAGAEVEIYLKGEKDRSTNPFAGTVTDEAGRFRVELPPGRYFLIGKMRQESVSGSRMLMAECPANPLEVTAGMRKVPPFSLREMGRDGALVPDPGTGVRGRVTRQGAPVAGAFIYVYTEGGAGLMGPSYGEAVQADERGEFQIDLPAGRYFLAARKRSDGARMGEPSVGDLNGVYPGNPVTLARGEMSLLGAFPLAPVEAQERQARLDAGRFAPTGTAFTGEAVDADGRPVAGVYVFAYLDSRMVGKPSFISVPTGSDGRFSLHLADGGTYYVGARSTFGGPLEPGEWVGTYDGRPDHRAEVPRGEVRSLGPIVVREVW